MKQQNEAFPSAIESIFLVIGLFVAEYLLAAILHDLRPLSGIDPRDLSGVIAVLGNGVLFSALMYYKRMRYSSLFHASSNSISATVGTLTIPILLVIPALTLAMWTIQNVLVAAFPLSRWNEAMFQQMMSNGFASVVTVCILAPILEEMLFRGVILRSFLYQYQPWHAIVGSAVLFGLAHLNIYQFAAGFIVGLLSGWLYERTRSLWPCIILHAVYNSIITAIFFLLESDDVIPIWEPPLIFWGASFLFAFIGASLLHRLLSARSQTA